jgi:uncharacterized membrane protein YgcG
MRVTGQLRPVRLALCALMSLLTLAAAADVARAQTPQGATLTVQNGTVAVVFANGSAVQPAGSGVTLGVGDQIGTVGNATALVTFFEGSELELGPQTTIILREIQSSGNEVHVAVEDVFGTAFGRVKTFASPNSSYRMQNPGGQTVAVIRGSFVRMTVFDTGGVNVAVGDCTRTCEIDYQGKALFQNTGEASFGISNAGAVTQGTQQNSIEQQNPDQSGGGGGGGDGGDGGGGDGGGGSSSPGYGLREETPLAAEWDRLRSRDDLNPLSATGGLLTLGLLGLVMAGSRGRRR